VALLLEQLELADGMAQGLDSRMDEILEKIDTIMQSLGQTGRNEELPEAGQDFAAVPAPSDPPDPSKAEKSEGRT
jgi:ribosome assembly protein YihI (activator of Der GTPase)